VDQGSVIVRLYRKHPAQVTAQEHHNEPVARQARYNLIVTRVEALSEYFDDKQRSSLR